ncbi:MAG: hypothetical protein A2X36_10680 [Elusimicrobia bacterium GWA2_69_24]|nr:MAG: hypothetical protein A2X36_10680 [Elusimicrobia bacterium GWA2_69_24]
MILTLTRACNLRCGFCPLSLGKTTMRQGTAAKAIALYLQRHPGRTPRIRFFGGEPLLRFRLLRRIVEGFPRPAGSPEPAFSFPTNGTLVDREVLSFLAEHPGVEAAVSRVRDARALAGLPNVVVTVCVAPGREAGMPGHLAGLLAAGFDRLNFLPAFFVPWSAEQLGGLRRSFRLAAALLRRCRDRGRVVRVRNVATANPVPLFNHGMVVDSDGDVFPSNAVLCGPFAHLRDRLRMGSVLEPARIDWGRGRGLRWDPIFRRALGNQVYDATRRVDDALTEFAAELVRGGIGG